MGGSQREILIQKKQPPPEDQGSGAWIGPKRMPVPPDGYADDGTYGKVVKIDNKLYIEDCDGKLHPVSSE